MFLERFDGQSRLLVRSLMSGPSGALCEVPPGVHRALAVLRRQQQADPDCSSPADMLETLCREEIAGEEAPAAAAHTLTLRPLVCLFPSLFKQNLLSFIYLVHRTLPRTGVVCLLQCLSRDPRPNPWVSALSRQLERSLEARQTEPLCSAACSRRLTELSQRRLGSDEAGGWARCFSGEAAESEPEPEPAALSPDPEALSPEPAPLRKRKSTFTSLDSDGDDVGQQRKRVKTDVCEDESDHEDNPITDTVTPRVSEVDASAENPAADGSNEALPEHIKTSALQIKELLGCQTEWDQSSMGVFRVLNDCDPQQVEAICKLLNLSDLPEQTLPKVCSSVLSLSPDLSYSTAATLIKNLLLDKVLSLSEAASRCLVTAVTSLCARYPRPMSHALIGPVLQEENVGAPQAELLNRLIESCLDSHYRLLVFQTTFKVPWSEAALSVIHSLLDLKPDLNEEVFTQFAEQLVRQSSQFTKSVKFAKMMLTVLTKYSGHVTPEHKHALSACLASNQTFLKKSLQAALKRIT
ncbi:Fanconi anemia group E protein [Salarias fasciatus]|uniref:Fanconi anemia group E protein n=1 Tax=Salarias fasciatus TaxID=181472 RepID=UPI001176CCCE|nr:Fanconi anemia group E protein [Salarias fasciatus]